jgi:predicted AlkP superfamily pyrophosphatase or phosphodiesterase
MNAPRSAADPGRPECLVLVSVDGLSAGDYSLLRELPAFRRLMETGAVVRRVRGVYPTLTYPQHASLVTGTYPDIHGITANTRLEPDPEGPRWFWYHRNLRVPTLYDAAAGAGLRTATLFWPSAGGKHSARVLPEIIPVRPGERLPSLVMQAGSPRFVLAMLLRYGYLLRGLRRRNLDNFTCACACRLIRRRKVDLLLLHLLDLDATRHRSGAASSEAREVLRMQDRRLARILAAVERSGRSDRTAVVVTGDHGHRDVSARIHINSALERAGLQTGGHGGASHRVRWEAWAQACDGSARIRLSRREDDALRRRVAAALSALQRNPANGIAHVLDRGQLQALRAGDEADFALEARPGFFFSSLPGPEVVSPACPNYRAAHGYLPADDDYSAFFVAAGCGFRCGAELEKAGIVDLGTTLAHVLGLTLPAAEGEVLSELLTEMGETL